MPTYAYLAGRLAVGLLAGSILSPAAAAADDHTAPAAVSGQRCDGWFASILSRREQPRYVILVFIKGRGLGGRVAARTAASTANYLIATDAAG